MEIHWSRVLGSQSFAETWSDKRDLRGNLFFTSIINLLRLGSVLSNPSQRTMSCHATVIVTIESRTASYSYLSLTITARHLASARSRITSKRTSANRNTWLRRKPHTAAQSSLESVVEARCMRLKPGSLSNDASAMRKAFPFNLCLKNFNHVR